MTYKQLSVTYNLLNVTFQKCNTQQIICGAKIILVINPIFV